MASVPNPARLLRHVRPVRPLAFPCSEPWEEHVGQSKRHLGMCTLLASLLRRAIGEGDSYGADQFVYWNGRDDRRCLAPDGFVKLGVKDELFDSWKTWERGVPELAIEVLSPSDSPERWTYEEKLERYHELGVRELVVFHVESPVGMRLRAYDRIDDDLVERVVEGERTPCLTLGESYAWVVAPAGELGETLRLEEDGVLVATDVEDAESERARAEAERSRAESERARAETERARADAAEARLRELEARLGSRS